MSISAICRITFSRYSVIKARLADDLALMDHRRDHAAGVDLLVFLGVMVVIVDLDDPDFEAEVLSQGEADPARGAGPPNRGRG